jgi:hypothetical protein
MIATRQPPRRPNQTPRGCGALPRPRVGACGARRRPGSGILIVEFIAPGGIGKTALAKRWLPALAALHLLAFLDRPAGVDLLHLPPSSSFAAAFARSSTETRSASSVGS